MVTRTAYADVSTAVGVPLSANTWPKSTMVADWITDIYVELYDIAKITYAANDATDTELIINTTWGAKFVKDIAKRLYYDYVTWNAGDKSQPFNSAMTEDERKAFKNHIKKDDDRPLIGAIDIFHDSLDV